jgi:uncharacterized membrane protein
MVTVRSRRPNLRFHDLLAVLSAALYAGVAAWTLLFRYATFHTSAFDFGLIGQASWNSLHGHLFSTTVLPFNYAAEHFAPSLILLSPLFLAWNDPRILLLVGPVAGGTASLLLYAVTRDRAGDPWISLLVQAGFELAPATSWAVLDEFHPIVVAMPLLALATYLFWKGHLRWAAAIGGLTLLANEDAAMWAFPFGLLIAVTGRKCGRVPGLLLSAVAIGWLATYLFVIVPRVRPPALGALVPHPDIGAFSNCGNTYGEVASCLLMHPTTTIQRLWTQGNFNAITNVLLPTAGLGLIGPSMLVAMPRWLMMLLGNQPPGYKAHYVALLAMPAYLATGETLGWVVRRGKGIAWALAVTVTACSLVGYLKLSDLPGGGGGLYLRPTPEELSHVDAEDEALSLIPSSTNVSVVATGSLLTHLELRPFVYLISEGANAPVDYQIYNLGDSYPLPVEALRARVALVRANPQYQLLFDREGVVVFKREWIPPQHPLASVFNRAIDLEGYSIRRSPGHVQIELFWRRVGAINEDYHFFVHLVDQDGRGYSQHDGEIADGLLGTSKWTNDSPLRDDVVIPAPPLMWWNEYHVEVGWYDTRSGSRLLLADGSDHVTLQLAVS